MIFRARFLFSPMPLIFSHFVSIFWANVFLSSTVVRRSSLKSFICSRVLR